jgi:16S rRNA (cytosine967-C5)-methyltransferase
MYYHSYFKTSVKLIEEFGGSIPLQHFLKKHFAANKKFGSKDRKCITDLCYTYFRLGHALKNLPVEEKILTAIFLCNDLPNGFIEHFKPEWNKSISLSPEEKLSVIDHQFSITDIFPWKEELSEGIDHEKFCRSFLVQPDLFLRIRPGNENSVISKLSAHNISYRQIDATCIALNNSTKIDQLLNVNKEVVVQDRNSQQVAKFFQPQTTNTKLQTLNAWDCCAGSGGKSIMLFDLNKNINLTVSDIRESILANLKKRFDEAGIKKYQSFITDLTTVNGQRTTANYDLIIADVPCTGSGTWSRTPEALYFFKEKEIERFSELQKKILTNIIPCLKKGGSLVYITCSVFKKENEEAAEFIRSNFNLKMEQMEILKGYNKKADTMFAARFTA